MPSYTIEFKSRVLYDYAFNDTSLLELQRHYDISYGVVENSVSDGRVRAYLSRMLGISIDDVNEAIMSRRERQEVVRISKIRRA